VVAAAAHVYEENDFSDILLMDRWQRLLFLCVGLTDVT